MQLRTMFVALSAISLPSVTDSMKEAGDIIECRPDMRCIGQQERHKYIWLVMSDVDNELRIKQGEKLLYKRRYQIPFARLNDVAPLDIARAMDPEDEYQPYIDYDDINGEVITHNQPIPIVGLVWDKIETRYL